MTVGVNPGSHPDTVTSPMGVVVMVGRCHGCAMPHGTTPRACVSVR